MAPKPSIASRGFGRIERRDGADDARDRITAHDVTDWYDAPAPGKERRFGRRPYSLLRTILGSATSARPKPLIPYNPAHIRGAGNVKQAHKVRPASLQELETIVEALPARYKLMALLAAWCAMRFGELAELRRSDIDLRTNRVSINREVVRSAARSSSARRSPMPASAMSPSHRT